MSKVVRLGEIYLADGTGRERAAPKHDGAALWLSYRKNGRPIERGNERALACPDDALFRLPEWEDETKAWDRVDLDHAPRRLCSYPGRDFARFPLDPTSRERQPIGACIHHDGVALVLYDDGRCEWLTLEQLGLDSDDDKTVGPDSKSPVLRVLRYGDGSVR